MRKLNLLRFFLPLLFAASALPQVDSVIVNGEAGFPRDLRPFGKYLTEICTLSGEDRTLTCVRTPLPPVRPWQDYRNPRPIAARKATFDQTITLKLACDPAQKLPCNPPIVAGKEFFIVGKSSSGQVVQQSVLAGNVTPIDGTGTVHYRANGPGVIVIRATANATSAFNPAAPVDILLPVISSSAPASSTCPVLPPDPPVQTTPLDAGSIVTLLGNPTPFVLTAQGSNTIAVYATRQPLRQEEQRILESFQEEIASVAGRSAASLGLPSTAKPFTVELKIPHASAFGDVAARINTLNYSQFTVQNVGVNQIRVTAPTQPDCDTWKGFLTDIRRLEWQLVSEPMNAKLFYLSSTDVATAFTGLATPASTTAAASASAAAATTTAATPVASPTSASITITQPPGSNVRVNSDTTPCVVAGLASGNPTACGASSTPAAAAAPASTPTASATAAASKTPLAMASVSVAAGIGEQNPPDLLVYSDSNPGDDAQIQERNRVLALLDLPRPEMIINAWVMQNSSTNPTAMGAFSSMVKDLVSDYDQEFERVVLKGWESVKELSTQDDNYFNEPFRRYIADRFVADTFQDNKPDATLQEMSQAFLDRSQVKLAGRDSAAQLGICGSGQYCLGYTDLFDPVKPALTDLLLTIIAAQDPIATVHTAVAYVEGRPHLHSAPLFTEEAACDGTSSTSGFKPNPRLSERCRKIWHNLGLDRNHLQRANCAVRDYEGILYSLFSDTPQNAAQNPGYNPLVHLQCFEEQAEELFGLRPHGAGRDLYGVGLLRAAIADFLFNYKLSQQYPHEFGAYDLSHSADALNNALSPLIDAFNRDLRSYQLFVRADLQFRVDQLNAQNEDRCCVKRLFGLDKPSFFNDGLITVRTISGQPTTVNTVSQSYLNASTAPELSTLLNSLTTNSITPGEGSLASAVFGANPVKRFSALAGALANYQTTFAQIGRSLNLTATPRSLNTASSAEITITLNADESTGPPTYNNGATTDPAFNTSRVATHDTATRVRVDSLKLFEVSSFTAIVERSRSRFPLLPPFVEIPYIGTFAGVPLGTAKEFHSSTAVLSAYVMPTAADIATGLRFVPDLVVDGANPGPCSYYKDAAGPDVKNVCLFRKALSLHDLRGISELPIVNFNKLLSRCFATDTSQAGCERVTLDRVPRSMN